jgi:hypothetical protein
MQWARPVSVVSWYWTTEAGPATDPRRSGASDVLLRGVMQARIRELVAVVERYADGLEAWETVSQAGRSVGTEWANLELWGLLDGKWHHQRGNAGLCACARRVERWAAPRVAPSGTLR